MADDAELGDHDYLKDLAERLMHVPVMHGTDGYDVDRVAEIARKLHSNPAGKVAGYTAQPDAKVALPLSSAQLPPSPRPRSCAHDKEADRRDARVSARML